MAKFLIPERGFIRERVEGAHITANYAADRVLLGEVTGQFFDPWGDLRLTVKFFNGEPWPFKPLARVVTVLERTYEPSEGSDRSPA